MSNMTQDYNIWLEKCKVEQELYNELILIKDNADEIMDRFYRALSFGTGGLRGVLGAGTNRMNIFTVGRATFGFGAYLLEKYKGPSVVIAYDSRNKSREFAFLSADILSSMRNFNARLQFLTTIRVPLYFILSSTNPDLLK